MAARTDRTPEERQRRFLAEYAKHGTVAHAAATAGIARSTIYQWRDADAEFAAAMDSAYQVSTDTLEASAYTRALAGDTTLTIFLLKGRRREVYGDRLAAEHSGPNGGSVQLTVTVVDDRGPAAR